MSHLSIWQEVILLILLVGCAVAFMVGLGLLLVPRWVLYLNRIGDRWFSSRRLLHCVSEPVDFDRWVFKHRRLFGFFLLILAIMTIVQLVWGYDSVRTVRVFGQYFNIEIVRLIEQIVYLLVCVGTGVGLIVGCLLLLTERGALLMTLKKSHWYSSRTATKFLETPYHYRGPERLASTHPRLLGILLILGSFYVAGVFLSLLK